MVPLGQALYPHFEVLEEHSYHLEERDSTYHHVSSPHDPYQMDVAEVNDFAAKVCLSCHLYDGVASPIEYLRTR